MKLLPSAPEITPAKEARLVPPPLVVVNVRVAPTPSGDMSTLPARTVELLPNVEFQSAVRRKLLAIR